MVDDVVGLRYVSEGLPEMLREIRTYQTALAGTARAETQRANTSRNASRATDTEARRAYQNYLRYQREKEAAALRASRAQQRAAQQLAAEEARAAQQAAQATQRLAAEKDRLAMKYRPLYAASKQYERALDEINRAHKLGVVSAQQHEDALERLNAEFLQFQNGTAGWSNQFVTGATRSAREVNRMGMVTQQVGYQVGDFLVQVQSGTNAFVAFGQQATQLAGLIGLVNPAMVGLGAALGIVIPLATALGAFFMRSRADAKEAAEAFDGVGSALRQIEDIRLSDVGVDMLETAQKIRQEYNDILGVMERVAVTQLQDKLAEPLRAAIAELEAFERRAQIAAQLQLPEPDFRSELGLDTYNEALFLATQLRRLEGETREELQAQLESITEALMFRGILTDEVEAMLVKLAQELALTESIREDSERIVEAQKNSTLAADTLNGIMQTVKGTIADAADEAGWLGIRLMEGARAFMRVQLAAREARIQAAVDTANQRRGGGRGTSPGAGSTPGERSILSLGGEVTDTLDKIREAEREAERAAKRGATAAARDAREAARELEKLQEEVEQLNFDADPVANYNNELKRLNELRKAGLSDGAYAAELAKANDELAKASPIISSFTNAFEGFLNGSIRSFKDFARKILGDFRNLLASMIATALRNHVVIPLTLGFSGVGGAANAASGLLGGAGGGGGLFGGVGGLAGLGSAFTGGMSFFASGVGAGFASGGIGGALSGGWTAITTALSGATGGLGGIAAAAGALAVPLAGVGLLIGAFTKKTKELDNGLRVTVDGLDASVDTFRKIETSRFFGLSRSRSTSFRNDPDNPLIGTVNSMQNSIMEAARVLGVGASAFDDFSYKFKVSLKGLTEEQKIAKINEELAKMGDAFTQLGTGVETMDELLRKAAEITASVKALTDTQDLFVTRADAVFAASAAGFNNTVDSTDPEVQTLLRELIVAVREGDINNARLTSRILELQERQELEPTP